MSLVNYSLFFVVTWHQKSSYEQATGALAIFSLLELLCSKQLLVVRLSDGIPVLKLIKRLFEASKVSLETYLVLSFFADQLLRLVSPSQM